MFGFTNLVLIEGAMNVSSCKKAIKLTHFTIKLTHFQIVGIYLSMKQW